MRPLVFCIPVVVLLTVLGQIQSSRLVFVSTCAGAVLLCCCVAVSSGVAGIRTFCDVGILL